MSHNAEETIAKLIERNHELESRYTHLQRMVEVLNEVVIEQGRKIDTLERQVATLMRQFGSLAERDTEPRSLEEEKPPHY